MSGAQDSGGRPWRPRANKWLIAVTVTFAAFMEILDTTIVNVSLPHIAGSLSSSYDDATWTLTSYLVANGIVLTISGWLATVFGRKRYFILCITAFTACSFLCGIADSLPELIVFRLMQGFFGGGLQPTQQAIILDTFPQEKRSQAFALTTMAAVIAPVIGPTLGGYITDNASWRWVFLINVPVGIVATFAIMAFVEDPPWAKRQRRGVDYIGLGLISLGLGCLQITLDRGEDEDWFGSPFIVMTAILACVGIVGAIGWLLTAKKPVVDIYIFADRNFAVGTMMIGMLGFVLYSSAVLIPQFAQRVIGYDATLAGLVLSPGGLVVIVLVPVVAVAMRFVQARFVVMTGFLIMGGSLVYSSLLVPDIDFTTLMLMRCAQTAGLAFLFTPINTLAYSSLSKEQGGDAAALNTMFRNVGGSIGISTATAMVTNQTQIWSAELSKWLTPLNPPYNALVARNEQGLTDLGRAPSTVHDAAVGMVYQTLGTQSQVLAYSDVFLFCAVLAFIVAPFALLFSARKGAPAGGAH